jgi:hemin uptake protein HemP
MRTTNDKKRPAEGSRSDGPQPGRPVARVTSRSLFADAREIVIEHAGRDYRLRITQNDKLILTA